MSLITVSENAHILKCVLNRPKSYNALSQELIDELACFFKEVETKYSKARVVILEGAGNGFSAGHDLKQIIENNDREIYERLVQSCSQMMMAIRSLHTPVIAKVHGVATAAGCQLVASCDLAYASDSARFATPGVMIGLFCSTPMVPLSRSVLPKPALEMLLTGKMISAQRAKEIGLINDCFADEQLEAEVTAVAETIASRSQTAIRYGKTLFFEQALLSEKDAYQKVGRTMIENLLHGDAQEGISAFLEKRKPNWKD